MASFIHWLLVCSLVPLVLTYPFHPATCYTTVLSVSRELTHWAAHLKWDHQTSYCMAHMPDLHLDVHNACVIYKMRTYISMLEELQNHRCPYTREVRELSDALKQLFSIMTERCYMEMLFTIHDCAALEREHPGYWDYIHRILYSF